MMISLAAYAAEMRHLEKALREATSNKDHFALVALQERVSTLNRQFWGAGPG